MVYVVGAVTAATAVQTPTIVYLTDPQHLSMCSPACLGVCDLLAGIFRDLVSFLEGNGGEAAFAVYQRRLDC